MDPPELLDANFGLPDRAPLVQLTHHGLALEAGRHNLRRLLYLPKQQRVISLSEDGWLTQW